MQSKFQVSISDALTHLPGPKGERWATVLQQENLDVEIYAPRGNDPQNPHTRDEVYVVMQGNGRFQNGETRHPFAPGDVLFVPAHRVHRFEDFTDNLIVWVIFYGQEK